MNILVTQSLRWYLETKLLKEVNFWDGILGIL